MYCITTVKLRWKWKEKLLGPTSWQQNVRNYIWYEKKKHKISIPGSLNGSCGLEFSQTTTDGNQQLGISTLQIIRTPNLRLQTISHFIEVSWRAPGVGQALSFTSSTTGALTLILTKDLKRRTAWRSQLDSIKAMQDSGRSSRGLKSRQGVGVMDGFRHRGAG